MSAPRDHDSYLAALPEVQRTALARLRASIRAQIPEAEECLSYGIPAFRLGKVLLGYGAARDHLALYLFDSATLAAFSADLSGFRVSAGTLRFSSDHPVPDDLLARLIAARRAALGGA